MNVNQNKRKFKKMREKEKYSILMHSSEAWRGQRYSVGDRS